MTVYNTFVFSTEARRSGKNPGRRALRWIGLAPLVLVHALFGGLTWWQVRQERQNDALITAIVRNDTPTALRLLNEGADPNAHDRRKESPVGWRDYLLQAFGHKHLQKGPTALQSAITDPYGLPTSLLSPSQPSNYTIALALLQHGADPNRFSPAGDVWPEGCTPLMKAADMNAPRQLIASLLAHGAKVNARDAGGFTALMKAAARANKGVAGMLVDAGADVNAREHDGGTALMDACNAHDMEMVSFLLAHRADINAKTKEFGVTALIMASMSGQTEVVRLLLNHGADFTQKDNGRIAVGAVRTRCCTALRYAKAFGYQDIAQLLKAHGAKE